MKTELDNETILRKAIEKARKNKWLKEQEISPEILTNNLIMNHIETMVIFDHKFAKAFWGKKPFQLKYKTKIPWKYHLQQMVLEEEPIKYLEQFLQ